MLIQIALFFFALSADATVFHKQTIQQQIKESDGIIIGHYLRSKTVELENGQLATQMIFKMKQEYGLQSDLFGMDEVIIHYPGGKRDHLHVKVDGVPTFVPGESVVLMIKSTEDRYWGMNLGFGSFKVINYGKEKLIVNYIFPDDMNVGQMRLDEFEKNVRKIKGSGLRVVLTPQYPSEEHRSRAPASLSDGKKRAIASTTEERENGEEPHLNVMWLIAFLGFMGGWFRFMRQKRAK